MGGLPHYNSTKAAVQKFEPVTKNMFDVTLLAPGDNEALLLEHIKSVDGLGLDKGTEPIVQKYKYASRSYAGVPGDTHIDVTIVFTLNLNDSNENYIYNAIKRWRNRVYNPLTGEMGLKKDYCGSAVILMHNRVGTVYRKIVLKDIFPTGDIDAFNTLSYEENEAAELSVQFRCDHWDEENLGL